MLKYVLSICLFLLTTLISNSVKSRNNSIYDKCIWVSEFTPQAIIKTKKSNEESGIIDLKADLIFKDKLIGEINMGEPNGYGSKWWSWETKGGNSLSGGGRIIPFFGNYPARGSVLDKDYMVSNPRKVLFVNMGSNLYYSYGYRNKHELIKAAEGFWRLSENCFFPGVLFNKRHIEFK